MRPLKLVMRAFGPYADEQAIDFGVLKERTFFLIHGPTGAGKTSILDAICFALYGETSGGERQVRNMRSDYGDAEVLTDVTFDFAIGAEAYRVFRMPEQERPKKRSSGTTKEPAKATLWKRTGLKNIEDEGSVIADRPSRVNDEIERLLGFRCDQFRQVVVLPQGQFRKLLSSGSAERQKILEMLFQTGIYRRVEEALKEDAEETKKEVERSQEKKKGIFDRLGVETIIELQDKLESAIKDKDAIEREIKELRTKEQKAEKALEQAKETLRKIQECTAARENLAELEARKEEFKNKSQVLVKARKASGIIGIENELRSRKKELDDAESQVKIAVTALESALKQQTEADEELKKEHSRQKQRESAGKEADRLEALRTHVKELALAHSKESGLEEKVRRLARLCDEKKVHLECYDNDLRKAQEKRDEAVALASKVDAFNLEHENMRNIYEQLNQKASLLTDYKKVEKELSEVQSQLALAEDERSSASRDFELMDKRWRKGQAAVLAEQLKTNAPCPVCGSTEHPMPAKDEGKLPTESDFELAKARLDEIDKRIKALRQEESNCRDGVVKHKTQIHAIENNLGARKDDDILSIKSCAEDAASRLEEAKKAKETLPGIETEIRKVEEDKRQVEEKAERARKEAQDAATGLEVARSSVLQLEGMIPEGLRTMAGLEDAIRIAIDTYREMESAFKKAEEQFQNAKVALAGVNITLNNAKETRAKARDLARKAEKNFLKRLEAAGFVDSDDYEASRMSDEAIEGLDRAIQEFNGKLHEAVERAQRTEKETAGLERPDIESIEARRGEIRDRSGEVQRRSGELSNDIAQYGSAQTDIGKIMKEISEKEAYYGSIGRLSEVASGKNQYNITFERFVLATLLDDVLA